jgi:hypothetical protein
LIDVSRTYGFLKGDENRALIVAARIRAVQPAPSDEKRDLALGWLRDERFTHPYDENMRVLLIDLLAGPAPSGKPPAPSTPSKLAVKTSEKLSQGGSGSES